MNAKTKIKLVEINKDLREIDEMIERVVEMDEMEKLDSSLNERKDA